MEIFIGIVVIGIIITIVISNNNNEKDNERLLIRDKIIDENLELLFIEINKGNSLIAINRFMDSKLKGYQPHDFGIESMIAHDEFKDEIYKKAISYGRKVVIDPDNITPSEYKYYFDDDCINIINHHVKTLWKKYQLLVTEDDYGNKSYDKYLDEIGYFKNDVLHIPFELDSISGQKLSQVINKIVLNYGYNQEMNNLENGLVYYENIDPLEYEYFCKDLLEFDGWDAKVTQATADQGVDVIATNDDGLVIAVQCKKYSSPVGNKAVQEVFSAKQHYNADIAIVVTNNTYTKSAKELANTTNVLLLHHDDLRDLSNLLNRLVG